MNTRPLEDMIMPLSNPIRGKDGKLMNEIYVPKGTFISIANWISNTNKAIWGEDAEEWNPRRFLDNRDIKQTSLGVYANLCGFHVLYISSADITAMVSQNDFQ